MFYSCFYVFFSYVCVLFLFYMFYSYFCVFYSCFVFYSSYYYVFYSYFLCALFLFLMFYSCFWSHLMTLKWVWSKVDYFLKWVWSRRGPVRPSAETCCMCWTSTATPETQDSVSTSPIVFWTVRKTHKTHTKYTVFYNIKQQKKNNWKYNETQ